MWFIFIKIHDNLLLQSYYKTNTNYKQTQPIFTFSLVKIWSLEPRSYRCWFQCNAKYSEYRINLILWYYLSTDKVNRESDSIICRLIRVKESYVRCMKTVLEIKLNLIIPMNINWIFKCNIENSMEKKLLMRAFR